MSRKNWTLAISIFSILMLMWVFHVSREWEQIEATMANYVAPKSPAAVASAANANESDLGFNGERPAPIDVTVAKARESQGVPAAPSPSSNPTPRSPSSQAPEQGRLFVELEGLQNQLAQERVRLEAQQVSLQQLRARQIEQQQRDPASYSSQLGATQTQIANFSDQLNGFQNLEADINRRAQEQLRQQSSRAQVEREQLDDTIRQQEDLIRVTQQDLAYWQVNTNYVTERDARLEELRLTLESQIRQLDLMRQQRLLSSAEVLVASQGIEAEKNQALNEIALEREDLREEIARLREYAFRLQEAQRQVRSTQNSLGSQILQTQRMLESQQSRVQALEEGIHQKNQELNGLQ